MNRTFVYLQSLKCRIALFAAFALLSSTGYAITPSDVYHEVNQVVAKLEVLKRDQAADKEARVPGVQVGKTPTHVYSKVTEVLSKIKRYQDTNNLPAVTVPDTIKSEAIKPANEMELAQLANEQVNGMLGKRGLSTQIDVPFQDGKTPSDVYEAAWKASYLMDTLVPPLKPKDVLRNAKTAEELLNKIAKQMGKSVTVENVPVPSGKKPLDVNIQAFKLLDKISKLQASVEVKPLVLPTFPTGKIKPEDVFDTTNNILAELNLVTSKLKCDPTKYAYITQEKVTPNDVYAQILRLHSAIDQLI